MRRKRRLGRLRGWWERRSSSALGAMSVLAAMTCGAPAVYGQMAAGDSGARPVILTFSYTGELVQNARGGARRGTTFAGAAGGGGTAPPRPRAGGGWAGPFLLARW